MDSEQSSRAPRKPDVVATILRLMTERGLTRADLVAADVASDAVLCRLFARKRYPDVVILNRIALALDVPLSTLITGRRLVVVSA